MALHEVEANKEGQGRLTVSFDRTARRFENVVYSTSPLTIRLAPYPVKTVSGLTVIEIAFQNHIQVNFASELDRLRRSFKMDIKPQAMALPKDTSTLPQGKYGPIFPKTPACSRVHYHREDYSRP